MFTSKCTDALMRAQRVETTSTNDPASEMQPEQLNSIFHKHKMYNVLYIWNIYIVGRQFWEAALSSPIWD